MRKLLVLIGLLLATSAHAGTITDPEWDVTSPTAEGDTTATLLSTTVTATGDPPAAYCAKCTGPGDCTGLDTGWQASPTFNITGMTNDVTTSWQVIARDAVGVYSNFSATDYVTPTAPPPGGGTSTLFEEFTDNITGWIVAQNPAAVIAWDASGDGQINADSRAGGNLFKYDPALDATGDQPTTQDHFAILEAGVNANGGVNGPIEWGGVATRVTSVTQGEAGGTDYNFATRITSGGLLEIRTCSDGSLCTTDGDTGTAVETGFADEGDQIAMATAGASGSEITCAWFWNSDAQVSDPEDMTTWGLADVCLKLNATAWTAELADYQDCDTGGGTTVCETVASYAKGAPADTHTWTSLYSGGNYNMDVTWFITGDVP